MVSVTPQPFPPDRHAHPYLPVMPVMVMVMVTVMVVDRLLHDDAAASTIMIHDGVDALLVDISLCVGGHSRALWLRESKTAVMALGYLEASRVRSLSGLCAPWMCVD